MTLTPDPAHAVTQHAYALVADIVGDPGSCAVYRLLYEFPGGCLGLRHDRDPKDELVPIPPDTIITRSSDVDQIMTLKSMLDQAWEDAGEGLRTYRAQIEPVLTQHGEKIAQAQTQAMHDFGIRAVFDTSGALEKLMAHARLKRATLWTEVVKALSTRPVLTENDVLA
ncbi:hypothetical protein MARCHEWKA_03170 [Brevundimonas phage vB_BpoS-Marchewka]|uniref:Uncharacterized protein n=1 Tax=Brevundimonas phage vB_BpoS-Marchewka TaxID=2948604 RepID=A0A9E7N5P6_9CAUD|nr:hypothetical protein MARCHEWKA_03170 [Brevundimonas phage vB_BpoS-Marchewka]